MLTCVFSSPGGNAVLYRADGLRAARDDSGHLSECCHARQHLGAALGATHPDGPDALETLNCVIVTTARLMPGFI